MPSRAKTSAGNIKMNLALDPKAADLLYGLAGDARSLGALVSNLILAEAQFRREEELRARARAHGRPASELRDALERLEASDARYDRLVGRLPAIVFELAADGALLFVNRAVRDITGFEPEELAERAWRDLLFPDELRDAPRRHFDLFANGDVDRLEVVMATRGGARVILELSTANHYSPEGRLEHVVGFAVDITERRQAEMQTAAAQEELRKAKDQLELRVQERTAALSEANAALREEIEERRRAEAALRERQHFIQRVVETTPHTWYVFDLQQRRRIWANRPVPTALGYTPEQTAALGDKAPMALTHPDDAAPFMDALRRLASAQDGEVVELEYRLRAADGSWHWYNSRATVSARDPDGAAVQVVGLAQDITERKRSQEQAAAALEALRNSEQRFRTCIENFFDALAILTVVRDDAGRIVDFVYEYVNQAACRSNELPREAHIGRRVLDVLPNFQASGLFDAYCRVVETGQPLSRDALIYEDNFAGRRLTRTFELRVGKLGDGLAVAWREVTPRRPIDARSPESQAFPG